MESNPEWILVGRIRRPHGAGGELLVESLTDFSERFDPGAELQLELPGAGDMAPVEIVASRPAEKGFIVRFAGVGDREEAKALNGAGLLIPFSRISPAENGSFYTHQLEGCRVYQGDELIGSVTALRDSKANPYLEVEPAEPGKPVLIPFVRAVISSIDGDARRIEISEGFLR